MTRSNYSREYEPRWQILTCLTPASPKSSSSGQLEPQNFSGQPREGMLEKFISHATKADQKTELSGFICPQRALWAKSPRPDSIAGLRRHGYVLISTSADAIRTSE
jgi:hypothetical protein